MKNIFNVASILGKPIALLPEDGEEVFKVVAPCLNEGNEVVLDFSGLRNASTTFFHSSIGELCLRFPDKFTALFSTLNMERPDWKRKYDDAIDLVRNPHHIEAKRYAVGLLEA